MSEFKGTPGPWHYDDDTRTVGAEWVYEGGRSYLDGDLVSKVLPLMSVEKMEANGELIAAAPELLEALKEALPWINNGLARGAHAKAVAAIKKALGQ